MHQSENGLTEFERAVLEAMARDNPWLGKIVGSLRVAARKFTGNGCYTEFEPRSASEKVVDGHIGLDRLISMPGISNGMGAVLFVKSGSPALLETFVYGGEYWDGASDGFSIAESA